MRLLFCLLLGCAPVARATGRCPTLPAFAADFAIGGAILAASVATHEPVVALPAGLVFLGANLAECRR